MGDHRPVNTWEPRPNNQYYNHNPYMNIPPPHALFPPPPPPAHLLPPPVRHPPPWESEPPYPPRNQQPLVKEREPSQSAASVQDWVDQWTKNKAKPQFVKNGLKIHSVRERLNAAFKLVRDLENSSRTLGVMVKAVSSEEWHKKCSEVEDKKSKLSSLLNEIKLTEEDFKLIKEKLMKRTKKRARIRRQAERRKKQKEEEKVQEQNNQYQIDNWQRQMIEEVERVKREEELKREADAVLWGVTQRKTEAKRQVAMLSALLTLRSVRVARLTAAGLPVSQSQIDTFNTVIERLKSMWSHQLEECQLEEQALRGMLGADDVSSAADDAVKTHRRLVLAEWETAIMGCVGTLDTTPRGEDLINVRRAWDVFAVREPSLLASTIPPGYILPVPPSSDLWRSFLKH